MTDLTYRPVSHNHEEFIEKALKRKGFGEAYTALADEYALAHELLAARTRAGLTQEEVAQSMGTTKSAVSRLESGGRNSPSVTTLKKYARAVGCEVEIHLVPVSRPAKAPSRRKARL
jgi:DNA-binding XRE family transcriptional regulator